MPTTGVPIDLGTLPMYRGDGPGRNCVVITFEDDNGDPIDMTVFGTTWKCQAKGSGQTITLDVDATQAEDGILTASVKAEDSPTLAPIMAFDIQVTGGPISPLTPFKGRFSATGQVTT